MLKVDYYLEDVSSYEIRSEKTLEIEKARELWNRLIKDGYTLKKEGVLSDGVYKAVFKYTGYFMP
jgi:hypothetical protein